MEFSIVIPVYNAEPSLKELTERIARTMRDMGSEYEIILVDDRSRDRSRDIIRSISRENPFIRYVFLSENAGQQAALYAGLERSRGDIVITMDDDLQHPPEEIPVLAASLEGLEGVFGFPEDKPHKVYRRWGSWMTDRLFNRVPGKDRQLKISSFRALRRSLVDRMTGGSPGFVYISALMVLNSEQLATVRHQQFRRRYGASNYTLSKLVKLYLNIIIEYSGWPLTGRFRKPGPLYRVEEESQ